MKIPQLLVRSVVGLLVLFSVACSTPDNSEPPAELTEITNAEKVREIWSVDTGKGAEQSFFDLQPLVLGNNIYTIDTQGLIQQINAKNGRADWQYESDLSSITGLAGHENKLLATSREGQVSLYEIEADTLTLKWQQQLNSEIRSRAVLDNGQVIIRTVDGKLSVLDASNGEVEWSVSRRVPALSLTGNSYPIVTEDLVLSGFANGKLVAFDRKNGSTVWERTVGSPSGRTEIERLVDLDGQFILRDGVIYISSFQGNLSAITVNSGQVVWTRKFSSYQAIEADDELLYLTDDQSHLWAIDRRTGSAFWKQDVLHARKITAPRLITNKLVVADLQGYVHYFAKADGKLLSRTKTQDERFISQPQAVPSMKIAIVLNSTGQLTALSQEH